MKGIAILLSSLGQMGAEPAPRHLSGPGQFILHYVRLRLRDFTVLLAALILAASCAVLMQYQMKRLVDAMAGNDRLVDQAWLALILFVTFMAVESTLLRCCAWLTCRATLAVGVKMRLDLFAHLSGQSIQYFSDNLAGSLGQRVTATAGNFGALCNTAVWRIIPPIVDFLGALIIFSMTDVRMTGLLALYVAAATGLLVLAGHKGRQLHSAYFARASTAAGHITDVISNMWTVKAFSARSREWQRLSEEFRCEAGAQHASWMYTEKIRVFYEVAVWIMAAGISTWAIRAWGHGLISAGSVVVIIALTFRILHGARDVALALVDASHQLGFIDDTLRVIGQTPSVLDSPAARRHVRVYGRIELREVTFGYDRERPVLVDFNLKVEPGEKVGIVGRSGAGKTTILQLLQRLHDVQQGQIMLDRMPLNTIAQDTLRSLLAVVPQEIGLFHRSIAENIRFGRPEASEQELMAAACAARCDEFVRKLPQGYDTLVGERGIKLSGGQRQRIGIARALLKDARFLLLDEATSALDSALEIEIQDSISKLQGCTVIAIAHRLSTLINYDRILVIDQGRIAEQGTPQELQRHGQLFRSLWRRQSMGLSLVSRSK